MPTVDFVLVDSYPYFMNMQVSTAVQVNPTGLHGQHTGGGGVSSSPSIPTSLPSFDITPPVRILSYSQMWQIFGLIEQLQEHIRKVGGIVEFGLVNELDIVGRAHITHYVPFNEVIGKVEFKRDETIEFSLDGKVHTLSYDEMRSLMLEKDINIIKAIRERRKRK